LQPDGLPFGVVSMDGKVTMLPVVDDQLTQRQTGTDKSKPRGALRTVTCALVSSRAKVVVHVTPIPACTNESGIFATAFDELRTAFPRLFRLVAYDAGACSEANGRHVVDAGYHYLFVLTDGQPTLLAEALRELAIASCVASTEDVRSDPNCTNPPWWMSAVRTTVPAQPAGERSEASERAHGSQTAIPDRGPGWPPLGSPTHGRLC
jgi:hypothetical protein